MSNNNHIYIKSIIQQPDGRFTIILGDGRKLENLGVCCNARMEECEDSFFYEIYFEKVKV